MKTIPAYFLGLLFLCLLIGACQTEAGQKSNKSHPFIGEWKVDQIFTNDEDISSILNPNSDRFMIFKEDQTFIQDGSPFGKVLGNWNFEKSTGKLKLVPTEGQAGPSEWTVNTINDHPVFIIDQGANNLIRITVSKL